MVLTLPCENETSHFILRLLLEQVHLLHQAWCETQSSSSTKKNKLMVTKYVQDLHLVDKCVRAQLTFLTLNQIFHSRNHSCAMRRCAWSAASHRRSSEP